MHCICITSLVYVNYEVSNVRISNINPYELVKLPPAERAKHLNEVMDIQEQVYLSMTGNLIPECRLDWVENIDVPGHLFHLHSMEMRNACDRLYNRLGLSIADRDLEKIIFSLMRCGDIAAMKMFEYGIKYQKMLDSTGTQK